MKKTILAISVSVFLSACGGGGSPSTPILESLPSKNPIEVEWKVDVSQLVHFGIYDSKTVTSWQGNDTIYSDVLASSDLNDDGFDDLVVGNFVNQGVAIKPTILIFNTTTSKFEPSENIQKMLPTLIWPRQAVVDDFNGDGQKDIFIADHGEEGGVHNGAQNRLFLKTQTGYADGSHLLPQIKDFSHSVVLADFDKNGRKDILVVNSPFIKNLNETNTNDSYVLFNTGTSSLVKGQLNLTVKTDINFNQKEFPGIAYHATTSALLNNDSIPDLILGGDDSLSILESNPDGSYKAAVKFQAPTVFKNKFPGQNFPYTYILAEDLDGDGQKEIIASIAHQETVTWNWLGSYFQVFKKTSTGQWQDATEIYFPDQTQSQNLKSWCYKLYLVDFNKDGKKDLVCSSSESLSNVDNAFWVFENNKFLRKNPSTYSAINLRQIFPVKLGNDTYMLGRSGPSEYYGWKLN